MDDSNLIWRGGKQYRELRRPDGTYVRFPVRGRFAGPPRKPAHARRTGGRR